MPKKDRVLNPVDKARKSARKKQIRKSKQNRNEARTTRVKKRDPRLIIHEMEKIDEVEYESLKKGYFNENILGEKRKRLREEFTRFLSMIENENPPRHAEMLELLQQYDSNRIIKTNAEVSQAEEMEKKMHQAKKDIILMLSNIPIPPKPAEGSTEAPTLEFDNEEPMYNSIILENKALPVIKFISKQMTPVPPPKEAPPPDAYLIPLSLKTYLRVPDLPLMPLPIERPTHILAGEFLTYDQPKAGTNEHLGNVENNLEATYNSSSTLSAKPILKDLQAEAAKFVPVNLMKKGLNPKDDKVVEKQKDFMETAYVDFMKEIKELM